MPASCCPRGVAVTSSSKRKSKSKGETEGADAASSEGRSKEVLSAAMELVKKTQKKVVVTETKKFAGQEIR